MVGRFCTSYIQLAGFCYKCLSTYQNWVESNLLGILQDSPVYLLPHPNFAHWRLSYLVRQTDRECHLLNYSHHVPLRDPILVSRRDFAAMDFVALAQ